MIADLERLGDTENLALTARSRMLAGYRRISRALGRRSAAPRYPARWAELPGHLRTSRQLAGTAAVSCGATHGIMEKCNFACSSCYLSDVANYTRPLPFREVKRQLEALRAYLGAEGKCQITSGEVTLLDKHELGRIVAYARAIGLDPMVMTNGQRLLQNPDYLTTLMAEYGLEKICLHIDTTQNGRPGLEAGMGEADLNPLRDRYAALIADARRQTGRRLHVANTVTVTEENFDGIPHIVQWVLANPDTVRLLSFLPVAQVGRTQDNTSSRLSMDNVWRQVCSGVGRKLNRHAMQFGHPQCNITVPVLVITAGTSRHAVEVVREDRPWDARMLEKGILRYSARVDLNRTLAWNCARVLPLLVRWPNDLLELVAYCTYRFWSERRAGWALAKSLLRRRAASVRPLLLVVHKFMDAGELASPIGQERLQACVFKVPVGDRMVSMCEVNVKERLSLNLEMISPKFKGRIANTLLSEVVN